MLIAFSLLSNAVVHAAEWRPLFDGTLTGWRSWLGAPHESTEVAGLPRGANGKYTTPLGWERDPLGVVSVVKVDGEPAIRLSGQVFGLLMSAENLGNYHLRLQFKWGEKKWAPRQSRPRDSGIVYHIYTEPGASWGVWPGSLEFQVQEHDCGDLYALLTRINGPARKGPPVDHVPGPSYTYDPAGEWCTFAEQPPANNRCMRSADFERPGGEWNTLELICWRGNCVHVVNGHVVMRLEGAEKKDAGDRWMPLTQGQIALQTEGAEVFYRRIEVQAIDALPAEFALK